MIFTFVIRGFLNANSLIEKLTKKANEIEELGGEVFSISCVMGNMGVVFYKAEKEISL